MADYTINAKVTADTSNFTKNMDQAGKATEEFNNKQKETGKESVSLGGKFSSLAGKIKTLAASYGLAKTAMAGITYNATMEQYETSFEVMTGSAEKAADTVERLGKIAAETPFEMPQLADTTQLLMNYGFTADEALDRMQMLGDISQGSADKMSRIATAYGQMSSAGKVQLEDIKQMIEAGFNPLQEISEETGESMESLYDRISKGTISVDEITASMQRSTSEGGKYFQSMDKQSQTLSGQFSTLKDTVNSALGEALEPFTNWLRDSAIPFAINFFENIETYTPIIGAFATVIGSARLAIFLYTTQQALAAAGTTILGAGLAALKMAFTALTSPIGLVTMAIGAVIAIGVLLVSHWEEVKEIAGKVWDWIKGKFEAFSNFLTSVFATDWSETFGFIGDLMNGFFASISNIWNSIKKIFNGIVDFVAGVFAGDWERAWDGIRGIFSGIWDGLVAIVKTPINGIISLINGVIGAINKISIKLPDWLPGDLGGKKLGFNIKKIPYLAQGTNNFQGGFAVINERGGELVNLPDGTQVIPHDISVQYAREAARMNSVNSIDLTGILEGVIINVYSQTNVDGTPLMQKSADYTIKKITNQQRGNMRAKGVTAWNLT